MYALDSAVFMDPGLPEEPSVPTALASLDADNDGDQDVVVAVHSYFSMAGDSRAVRLLRNVDGKLQRGGPETALANVSTGLHAADLDQDGRVDLISKGENLVEFLHSNGDGSFNWWGSIPAFQLLEVTVGHLDEDALPDFVLASTNSLSVCRQVGGMAPMAASCSVINLATAPAGVTGPYSVFIRDYDGAGRPDLVVVGAYSVAVFLQDASGLFALGPSVTVGANTDRLRASQVMDLNNDGRLDVVAGNSSLGNFSVLRHASMSNSLVKLDPAVVVTNPNAMDAASAVGDINGDGRPDLVFATSAFTSGAVRAYLGNGTDLVPATGNPLFTRTIPSGGAQHPAVVLADLNGDGAQDVVFTHDDQRTVGVVYTRAVGSGGSGSSGPMDPCLTGGNAGAPGAVAEMEPNNTFMAAGVKTLVAGVPGFGLLTAGDRDVWSFTLTAPAQVRIQSFDGNPALACCGGTFATTVTLKDASGVDLGSGNMGPPGGCGFLDAQSLPLLMGLPAGTYFVDVLGRPVTPGNYQVLLSLLSTCGNGVVEALEACDDANPFSSDGCEPDCTRTAAQCGDAYPVRGEHCFEPLQTGPDVVLAAETCHPNVLALGDFNKDGWEDLAVGLYGCAGTPGKVRFLLGQGAGMPHALHAVSLNVAFEVLGMAVGDLDKDGWPDLVLGTSNGVYLAMHTGDVELLFGSQPSDSVVHAGGGFSRGFHEVLAVDADGDGDLDVLSSNSDSGGVVLLLPNLGMGTLDTTRTLLTTAGRSTFVGVKDVDFDGDLDVMVLRHVDSPPENRVVVLRKFGSSYTPDTGRDATMVAPDGQSIRAVGGGDFNLDCSEDALALESTSGRIYKLANDGVGNLRTQSTVLVPNTTNHTEWRAALGDMDGDSVPDVVLTAQFGNVLKVFISDNPVNGMDLQTPVVVGQDTLANGNYGGSVVTADVNHDGLDDILFTSPRLGHVGILVSNP